MIWLTTLLACGTEATAPTDPTPAPEPPAAPAPQAPEAPAPTDAKGGLPSFSQFGLRGVDYACPVCEDLTAGAPGVKVTASTTLAKYPASNVLDPSLSTAWCEGDASAGVGQTLRVELGVPRKIEAIGLYGGFLKSLDLLKANGRVESVRITSDSGVDEVAWFEDPAVPKEVDSSTGSAIPDWFEAITQGEPPWHTVTTGSEAPATWFQLEILSVYPGAKYTDTCVSRLAALIVDPEEL
ncbi:MAG: discoidin domain-containing protein [Myxococcota bacterium]